MLHHEVEIVIRKYTPNVVFLFADRFERWPVLPNANIISDALYNAEKVYRSINCVTEADECFKAAVELQLHKNGS
jgi:hypothetical protein